MPIHDAVNLGSLKSPHFWMTPIFLDCSWVEIRDRNLKKRPNSKPRKGPEVLANSELGLQPKKQQRLDKNILVGGFKPSEKY